MLVCADFSLTDLCERQAASNVSACLAKRPCLINLLHPHSGRW